MMNVNKKTAKIAGILYVIIVLGSILGGIFSEMYMQGQLIETAADAADALVLPQGVYRTGFVIYLLAYAADLATALVLYVLLKPVDKNLALLAAFFRLAEAIILGINMLNHYAAFLLVNNAGSLAGFQPGQLESLASLVLDAHRGGYLIGQVFFGFHVFLLGYLLIKSGYFPRWIGLVLLAASFGYLLESFSFFLLPNFTAFETIFTVIVAVPAFISEIALTYWLLFKGDHIESQYQQIAAAA